MREPKRLRARSAEPHLREKLRGVPVTMEDPHSEELMEQQDSSKERSPGSPRGDIYEETVGLAQEVGELDSSIPGSLGPGAVL